MYACVHIYVHIYIYAYIHIYIYTYIHIYICNVSTFASSEVQVTVDENPEPKQAKVRRAMRRCHGVSINRGYPKLSAWLVSWKITSIKFMITGGTPMTSETSISLACIVDMWNYLMVIRAIMNQRSRHWVDLTCKLGHPLTEGKWGISHEKW